MISIRRVAQNVHRYLHQTPRYRRKDELLYTRPCPPHEASASIPSEPPSLAHPTWRGIAAEKGGVSLWWARASSLASRAQNALVHFFRRLELEPRTRPDLCGPVHLRETREPPDKVPDSAIHPVREPIDGNGYVHPECRGPNPVLEMLARSTAKRESAPAECHTPKETVEQPDRQRGRRDHGRPFNAESGPVQLSFGLRPHASQADGELANAAEKRSETAPRILHVEDALKKEARPAQPSEEIFLLSATSFCHCERRSNPTWMCSKHRCEVCFRREAPPTSKDRAPYAMEARQPPGFLGGPLGNCQRRWFTPNSPLEIGAEAGVASTQTDSKAAFVRASRASSGQGLLLLQSAARNRCVIRRPSPTRYPAGPGILEGVSAASRRGRASQRHLKFQLLRAAASSFCVGYPRMALIPPRLRSV